MINYICFLVVIALVVSAKLCKQGTIESKIIRTILLLIGIGAIFLIVEGMIFVNPTYIQIVKNTIRFLQEKGIPGIFNACEAGLWFILAAVFYFFKVFDAGDGTKRNRIMSVLLIFFGISDIIEIHTGAWWEPWWLFLWKAICFLGMGAIFIQYYRKKQLKFIKNSRRPR